MSCEYSCSHASVDTALGLRYPSPTYSYVRPYIGYVLFDVISLRLENRGLAKDMRPDFSLYTPICWLDPQDLQGGVSCL